MRHALLHGETISSIEGEQGVTLSQVVDWIGKVGRAALLTALGKRAAQEGDVCFRLLYPNTFLHQGLEVKSRFSFTSPADREPMFDDIPKVTLN
jgi:hypothetical protein